MKSLIGRSRKWMVFFIDVNYDRAGLALIRVATDKYVTSLILFQTREIRRLLTGDFFFSFFLLLHF